MRRYFDELFESFSEVRVDDVELKDLGNRVVALYKLSVRGRDSVYQLTSPAAWSTSCAAGRSSTVAATSLMAKLSKP